MKGKYRTVSTRFWKDKWIRSLDPIEKMVYLYLLTNPETTICGVYQTTLDEIAHDTGVDHRQLSLILERFAAEGKAALYMDEWVIIPNFLKHQNLTSPKIQKGVERELENVPEAVISYSLSIGYAYDSINSNFNFNSNLSGKSSADAPQPPDFSKLYEEYDEKVVNDYYQRVLDYEQSKYGKRHYKNYPATIRNWLKRDKVETFKEKHPNGII